MGGQTVRGRLARLARAIREVRELTVETGYVTAPGQEPEAGAGHPYRQESGTPYRQESGTPYRQESGTLQSRPIATTVLDWGGLLGDVVAGSDEAAPRPQVVSEAVYESDPVLRGLHQGNVAAAPAYWLRLARAVRRSMQT